MNTLLNPYLGFLDNARQAMNFYQSVLGGELEQSTFGESNASEDPGDRDKIMHSALTTDNGMVLMASDTPTGMEYTTGSNYSVSLSGDDETALRGYWDKLSEGGVVAMPLERAPWGDSFGMCVDKFGVSWLVNIAAPKD
ncbi:MAG: VOC family protein [Terrimesophilobacter sp.]